MTSTALLLLFCLWINSCCVGFQCPGLPRFHVQSLLHGRPRTKRFKNRGESDLPPVVMNEDIKASRVRVLIPSNETESGEKMAGVFTLDEALAQADQLNLDLILIKENADPPLCKIMDSDKFVYTLDQRKKETVRKHITTEFKEVKLSVKIDQHDVDVRLKAAQKFMSEGSKVKVLIQFKGRENVHKELGATVMKSFFDQLKGNATIESEPTVDGRSMMMVIAPKKAQKTR